VERQRDVAVVLSGGGINGLLLEVGFLKRLQESELWPRVGFFFGTSAGAVNACMAALDRVDELEEFILGLRPEDTFRPNRLWRLPLLGSHDYTLPQTPSRRSLQWSQM
jgi:predicted acylesterase/phospholipase RssA